MRFSKSSGLSHGRIPLWKFISYKVSELMIINATGAEIHQTKSKTLLSHSVLQLRHHHNRFQEIQKICSLNFHFFFPIDIIIQEDCWYRKMLLLFQMLSYLLIDWEKFMSWVFYHVLVCVFKELFKQLLIVNLISLSGIKHNKECFDLFISYLRNAQSLESKLNLIPA